MTRGVDQVELVGLAVLGGIVNGDGTGLDGDAALALEIHAVQNLLAHFTGGQTAAGLDQAVGKRTFAVVDVRNNGKVTDIVHSRTCRYDTV